MGARGPKGGDRLGKAVREFQGGKNREANFVRICDHYRPRLEKALRRRVYSSEERRDLIQDCLFSIYRGLDGVRSIGSLDAWVYTILYNHHLQWLERRPGGKKALDTEPLGRNEGGGAQQRSALEHGLAVATPLDQTIERERKLKLREAIDKLPPQMRKCVELRVYQNLSIKEIAVALRLAEGTVKKHLFDARQRLRRALEKDFEGIDF